MKKMFKFTIIMLAAFHLITIGAYALAADVEVSIDAHTEGTAVNFVIQKNMPPATTWVSVATIPGTNTIIPPFPIAKGAQICIRAKSVRVSDNQDSTWVTSTPPCVTAPNTPNKPTNIIIKVK